MNHKSLFMSNFKFKKNKNDDNYRTAESLNQDSNLLDTTLNTTLNSTILDEHLSSLNNEQTDDSLHVPSNHLLSADQIIINTQLGEGKRS